MLKQAERMRKAGKKLLEALTWEAGLKLKTDLAYMEMKEAVRGYETAVREQKAKAS